MLEFIKKYWGWAIFLAVLAYAVNQHNISKQKKEIESSKQALLDKHTEEKIFSLIRKYQANYLWINDFNAKDILEPLMTVDLQRQWVQDMPIFFLGQIEDVSIKTPKEYELSVNYDGLDLMLINTELRLKLSCSKKIVDDFLVKHKKDVLSSFGTGDTVAIIAKINSIESFKQKKSYETEDGRNEEDNRVVRVGVGDCVALEATGAKFPNFTFLKKE